MRMSIWRKDMFVVYMYMCVFVSMYVDKTNAIVQQQRKTRMSVRKRMARNNIECTSWTVFTDTHAWWGQCIHCVGTHICFVCLFVFCTCVCALLGVLFQTKQSKAWLSSDAVHVVSCYLFNSKYSVGFISECVCVYVCARASVCFVWFTRCMLLLLLFYLPTLLFPACTVLPYIHVVNGLSLFLFQTIVAMVFLSSPLHCDCFCFRINTYIHVK